MSIISIRNVTKEFGGIAAVDDANIEIAANEFFAVLGPSGCGKTTLLRMLAGFETPTTGEILIDGVDVSTMAPNRRPVNMVFQSYAVFPHMTVLANVGYGLKVTGVPAAETRQRAEEALEMVQLAHLGGRQPDQLSGGQRQRVALARALVKRPKVLLLDEPMSALDAKLREQMQLELTRLQEEVGITFVIVTHDQDEALSMADRIAVMQSGRVEQIATPELLYESPNSRFVADFIGRVNLLDGQVTGATDQGVTVDVAHLGRVTIPHSGHAQGGVSLAVRPEKIRMTANRPDSSLLVQGRIVDWAYYGDASHIRVQPASGPPMSVTVQNETRSTVESGDVGDQVWLSWRAEDTLVLDR
ncbi:MAG: ABC transporter ATP-binding protein [Boseongicola sp.]|nr:ABC transporter ATP-binding protein [Boseongicola sp.]